VPRVSKNMLISRLVPAEKQHALVTKECSIPLGQWLRHKMGIYEEEIVVSRESVSRTCRSRSSTSNGFSTMA